MSVTDFIVWLLLVLFSVLLFFALPLLGGFGHLNWSGLKLIIAGVPIILKLFHSVLSDQKPKTK
jgi:hypothetical protein